MNKQMIHIKEPNFYEVVVGNSISLESSFKSLNVIFSEYKYYAISKDAPFTMDYKVQAFGDPGIAASTFVDVIRIKIKLPLIR